MVRSAVTGAKVVCSCTLYLIAVIVGQCRGLADVHNQEPPPANYYVAIDSFCEGPLVGVGAVILAIHGSIDNEAFVQG